VAAIVGAVAQPQQQHGSQLSNLQTNSPNMQNGKIVLKDEIQVIREKQVILFIKISNVN